MRATSASEGRKSGGADAVPTNRVQPESAHVYVDRGQRADRPHICRLEADLLVRFAERGLLEGSARIDRAARQRYLPAVQFERAGANGQDEMGTRSARKQEQQARRLSNARRIEIRTPLSRRPRRHERLRVGAGQRAAQRGFEPRHRRR